jgi:hypothetical protein
MQFARATSAKFESTFLDQDGEPQVPADPVAYPAVVVKDPAGTMVASGVGKPIGNGKYVFRWFVPNDAEINPDDRQWSIEWFFTTITGHNLDAKEAFSIVDKVDPGANERAWTYLIRAGLGERLFLRLATQPEELGVELLDPSHKRIFFANTSSQDLSLATEKVALPQRKIGKVVDEGGRYVYFFNTDPLGEGEYLVFWFVRESTISPMSSVQQLLRVPEMRFWHLLQPMRILLDRLQKKVGWVQSYSDSDIYEFLIRGLDMANNTQPTTNWTLTSIPLSMSRGVIDAVLLYAASWALISQQILETELNFDYNGQTVTLGYHHDYAGVFGNINGMLERFKESKQHIYRIANGPGKVGVRPKNWRYTQRVWRVDGWGFGSPYDVSSLLTSVGIG